MNERYKLPITVDNDVNLAALGELWFGAGQNVQNMILITIGAGIGAGIIIDGTLYRGSTEASGEIGHMIPGREFLGKSFIDFGALESVASATGIVEKARAASDVCETIHRAKKFLRRPGRARPGRGPSWMKRWII